MRSGNILSRFFGENTFGGFEIVLFFILVLFIFTNVPALKLGLPYIYNWDEPGMMIPVINALKTGNFNQFKTPQETRIYDGYIHWAVLGAAFVNFLLLTGRGAILSLGELHLSTAWDLEISHPSFYLTGRLVILIAGLICLCLLYQIAAKSVNKFVALLAAFILAIVPRFGFYSTKTLPYVPMTLGVLLTVYFLLRYNETPSWKHLTFTALAIAMAASMRITCVILLVPAIIVLLWSKTHNKILRICSLVGISLFAEIMINFHQLVSFDSYMDYIHRLVLQSQVIVPEYADGVPGFSQIRHYGLTLINWFRDTGGGIIPLYYFCILAIPVFFMKSKFRVNFILWSIPGILFFQLIEMKYNRVVQICFLIPFIALLAAIGIYNSVRIMLWAGNLIRKHCRLRSSNPCRRMVYVIIASLVAIFMINPVFLFGSLLDRYRIDTNDSRTKAMLWIADNADRMDTVVVAEELRVHPHDLRLPGLKQMARYCRFEEFKNFPAQKMSPKWMVGLFKKLQQSPEFIYRQPDLALYFFQKNMFYINSPSIIIKKGEEITCDWLEQNNFFGGYIVGYKDMTSRKHKEKISLFGLHSVDKPVKSYGDKFLFADSISVNPRVDIFRIPPKDGCYVPLSECDIQAPKGYFLSGDTMILYRRGNVIVPLKDFSPGKYRLWLNARGDKIRGEGPKIRIKIEGKDTPEEKAVDDLEINSNQFKIYASKTFIISPEVYEPRIRIEFYYDDLQRRGRVLYVKDIFVEKLKNVCSQPRAIQLL